MSNLEKWDLRGAVRMVTIRHAVWNPASGEWQDSGSENVVTFRADGLLSELEQRFSNGSVSVESYTYDEAGRLTRVRMSGKAAADAAKTFSYAPDGRKTSVQDVSDIKADSYAVEGTDSFYGAPNTATITQYYDATDLPAEVLFHDAAGTLLRRVRFVRDVERRLILEELQWGDPGSVPEMQPILNAVPAEERAAAIALLAQQFTWSTRYEYDDRGRLASVVRQMGTMGEERSLYRYDDRGHRIEEISSGSSREVQIGDPVNTRNESTRLQHTHFTYTFDAQGNWTERVVSRSLGQDTEPTVSNTERRTITYYTS